LPISRIEVNEYVCLLCGYRWINRVNGKNGPIPERCAKCKRYGWNGERKSDIITPEESGLRRRIKNLPRVYHAYHLRRSYDTYSKGRKKPTMEDCFDIELTAKFLTLDPRPTIEELKHVLYTPGLQIRLNSQTYVDKGDGSYNPKKQSGLNINTTVRKRI
jgi:hypothetical protein